MATVQEVLDGLEGVVNDITNLDVVDYVPDNLVPPCAFILPPVIRPNLAMGRGLIQLEAQVIIVVSKTIDADSQKALIEYMSTSGARSVDARIFGTPALGLAGTSANTEEIRPLGVEEAAAYGYYGCAWDIIIYTPGV